MMDNETKKYVTQAIEEITQGKTIAEYCETIKNNKICILSNVGSGKSQWVKEYLTEQGRVLFVTSRRAKVDQDIKTSGFTINIKKGLKSGKLLLTNSGLAKWISDIGSLYDKKTKSNIEIDIFLSEFDYLVFDEIHSLYTDATFAKSALQIFDFIDYAAKNNKIIIGMTGTEYPINAYLKYFKWDIIDLRKECKSVLPKQIEVISKEEVASKLSELRGKTVYFSNTAKNIRKNIYPEMTKIFGIDKVAVIQSPDKEAEFYKEIKENIGNYTESIKRTLRIERKIAEKGIEIVKNVCEKTMKEIERNQKLPETVKILLSTSKLKEGIEIKNEDIEFIFCESLYLADIIQYYGRIRKSLKKVYIIYDAQQYIVPYNWGEANYSWHYAVKTVNKYIQDCESSKMYIFREKEDFESYLEKTHQYIEYSHVYSRYRFFVNRLGGQTMYMRGMKNWLNELTEYCEEYGIRLDVPEELKESKEEKLEKILQTLKRSCMNNEPILVSDTKQLRKDIKKIGNLKNQNIKILNEFLRLYGYKIEECRSHSKRAWRIVENILDVADISDEELFG